MAVREFVLNMGGYVHESAPQDIYSNLYQCMYSNVYQIQVETEGKERPLAFCLPKHKIPHNMYMPLHPNKLQPATILYNFKDLCTSLCPGAVDLLSSNVSKAVNSWKKPLHSHFSSSLNCEITGDHSVSTNTI